MTNYDDIVDGDCLGNILSSTLKKVINGSCYELVLLFEESDELDDANELIRVTFPSDEFLNYDLRALFCSGEQPLVLACVKDGVVIGIASLDISHDHTEICCLAVDKEYRDQKIGSLLMVGINDILLELKQSTLCLHSSPNGKLFYESFGFKPMAMQHYQIELPFEKGVIDEKLTKYSALHCLSRKRQREQLGNGDNSKRLKIDTVKTMFSSHRLIDVESTNIQPSTEEINSGLCH